MENFEEKFLTALDTLREQNKAEAKRKAAADNLSLIHI